MSAVLSDISALSYNYRYEYKKRNQTDQLVGTDKVMLKVLLKHTMTAVLEYNRYFQHIQESYRNQDFGYIIGILSLSDLEKILVKNDPRTSVVLFDVVDSTGEYLYQN